MNPDALPEARSLLAELDLVPLTGEVVDAAGELEGRMLRSLDALHLASVVAIRAAVAAVVVYDRRLAEAFTACGLGVVRPEP